MNPEIPDTPTLDEVAWEIAEGKEQAVRVAESWSERRDAAIGAFAALGKKWRAQMDLALMGLRKVHPLVLDLRMRHGFYGEDLAESHGDAEDVFH